MAADRALILLTISPCELALGYALAAGFSLCLGSALSMDIRSTLSDAGNATDTYYGSVSFHGIVMIFGFVMPLLFGVVGNILIPTLGGYSDMIYPRTNTAGLYLLINAVHLFFISVLMDGTASMGWTLYPPISYHQTAVMDLTIIGLHAAGISSLVLAINSLITTFQSKPARIGLIQIPLILWSTAVANVLLVFALPVLAAGITMLLLDRTSNTAFFVPVGDVDVVLYQHLFWFFGHPEVYVLILPCFGMVSHLISADLRGNILNPMSMILALITIGNVSFVVWGHHMYTVGMNTDVRAYFTWATFLIAVPTGAKYYTWLASINQSCLPHTISLHGVCGFLFFFAFGGYTGVILANAGVDLLMHDTYYVIGHFHIIMAVAIAYSVLAMLVHLSNTML